MKRWLSQWSVNEDEPSVGQTVVAGLTFVLLMIAIYASLVVIAASMDSLP